MKKAMALALLLIAFPCYALAPEEVEFFGVFPNGEKLQISYADSFSKDGAYEWHYASKSNPNYKFCWQDEYSENAKFINFYCSSSIKGKAEVTYRGMVDWEPTHQKRLSASDYLFHQHWGSYVYKKSGNLTDRFECFSGCGPKYVKILFVVSFGD